MSTAFPRAALRHLISCTLAASLLALVAEHAQADLSQEFPAAQRRLTGMPPIRTMALDSSGFLWLGTEGGLFRYDGRRALRVAAEQLGSITDLVVDASGVLWLLVQDDNVTRIYSRKNEQVVEAKDIAAAVGAKIQKLVADGAGTLWILSEHGLFQHTAGATQKFTQQPPFIVSIFDVQAALWVSTADAIYRLEQGAFQLQHAVGKVTHLSASGSDVWMRTDDNRFFRSETELAGDVVRKISGTVHALAAWHSGLLIATDDRLYWTNGQRVTRLHPFATVQAWLMKSLAVDQYGTAWIGTDFDGLFRLFPHDLVQTMDASGPMNLGRVTFSVTSDGGDGVWAVNGTSISHWHAGQETRHPIPPELKVYTPRSISVGPQGTVWVSADERGLLRLDNGRFELLGAEHGLANSPVEAVFHDRDGNLLAGFASGAFSTFQQGQLKPLWGSENCPAKATAIFQGPDEAIWVATEGAGLCLWDGQSIRRFTTDHGLPENNLRSVYVDASNTVWVGGNELGLAVQIGDRFVPIPLPIPLHKEEISAIAEDRDQHLWLATPRGLLRIFRPQALATAKDPNSSLRVLRLGMEAGLPSGTFLASFVPSVAKTQDGSLWFPSLRGLVKVPVPEQVATQHVPKPTLENVRINLAPLGTTNTATSMGSFSATISLAALQHPERFLLRHKLEGIDSDWQVTTETGDTVYARLPPGSYRFRVAAFAEDSAQRGENSISFVLLPPFYRRAWFVALLTLVFALTLLSFHRLRLWRQRDKFEAIVKERVRIARDMHDTLEQTLIGMRLQMESLRKRADDSTVVNAKIKQLESLIDQGLQETKRTVWALRMPMSQGLELKDALALTGGKALRGTDVSFRTTSRGKAWPVGAHAQEQLTSIVGEATNNALKHGNATEINVELEYSSKRLKLSISDNGSGFEAGSAPGPNDGHFGLCGMTERAKILSAELQISSTPGQGTTVSVLLPRRLDKNEVGKVAGTHG